MGSAAGTGSDNGRFVKIYLLRRARPLPRVLSRARDESATEPAADCTLMKGG